jgi:FtsP/CotA-like multicopper oxidase with cupredoxin domain
MPTSLRAAGTLVCAALSFGCTTQSEGPSSTAGAGVGSGSSGSAGGSGGAGGEYPSLPDDWASAVALAELPDEDPDDGVLEVTLHAGPSEAAYAEGFSTPIWGYEGTSPGPLLRARQGDRLKVHFISELPEDTTIHWHGVRVPNDMDGVPMVSGTIPPGGTFEYDFVLPDAGTFWYHPHAISNKEVSMGLYGALVVDPPVGQDPLASLEIPEATLVLDDVNLEDDGTLSPYDKHGNLGDVFGREGKILLVNGKVLPTLEAQPGRPVRFRLVNAAVARYFALGLEGHTFTQVGNDGGYFEAPKEVQEPLIVPGGRADIIVVPQGEPGEVLAVRWMPFERGFCTSCRDPEDLFYLRLVPGPPGEPLQLPDTLREIAPIDTAQATLQALELTQVTVDGEVVLGVNGAPFGEGLMLQGMVGETQLLRIKNTTQGDHPFHLHGFFFQPVALDGVPYGAVESWDTFNIPLGKTVDLAVIYDDRPGMWMLHCHILDHAEIGMMAMLHVM